MHTPTSKSSYKESLFNTIKTHTKLSIDEINEMVESIPVTLFNKGDVLLNQGDRPKLSYYVIEGCVRQFSWDEAGKETTLEFFTESQSINMFSFVDEEGNSWYSLECLEDCALVTCADYDTEEESVDLLNMKYSIFTQQFTHMQSSFMNYKASKPIERYNHLVKTRPELLDRVPQNILANFIGITPESFSRFKKREQAAK